MKEKILRWCLPVFYIVGILGVIITGIDYYIEIQKEKNRLLTLENILEVENVGEQIQLELNSQNKNEDVVYEVTDPSIIEVSNNGTLVSIREGTTTITVTNNDNTKAQTFVVAVGKDAIKEIRKENDKIQQLIEQNKPLLPSNDTKNELELENSYIENELKPEIDYPKDIKVAGISLNKTDVILDFNKSIKLVETIKPTNATNRNVIWSSSDSNLVSVDSSGNIKAVANQNGTAIITATTVDGSYNASATITVKSIDSAIKVTGISLNKNKVTLEYNKSTQLKATIKPTNATNRNIIWSSSDSNLVSVDGNGNIKAVANKNGKATITAITIDGRYETSAIVTVKKKEIKVTGISLNKTDVTLDFNKSAQLTATIKPTNATNKNVIWSTTNSNLVSVDGNGNIKAVANKNGKATITVTTKDGYYKASAIVTVKAVDSSVKVTGISLDKTNVVLAYNESMQLIAIIKPTNATNKNVKWISSDSNLVSVDASGNVKAVADKNGKVTIKAISTDGNYEASATVTVKQSIATDRITFESMSNGNAILLQSSDNFMLIDVGKGTNSCTSLVNDIANRTSGRAIKYVIISHLHNDHVGCLINLLQEPKVIIENIIIKDYTNYIYDEKDKTTQTSVKQKYNIIMDVLKSRGINVYQIYDSNNGSASVEGHDFSFIDINRNPIFYIGTSSEKDYGNGLSITVNNSDLNRSRINLSLGNYYLRLFNLPLRNDSENLNSISVYGTVDGYKFYLANDLTNAGINQKYSSYGNTTTLVEKKRVDGITPSRLADYYAWFVNQYFSKGTVDLYQAGHHGYSNGTTTYISNLLIEKNTKIVFTNSANQQYSSINGWKENKNQLFINQAYITNNLCSSNLTDDIYHRCLNDYTIARISYVLNSKGSTKTGIYYLANNSDYNEKPLTFGFNNPNVSRITVSGGEYITYEYNKNFNDYALYEINP